jgi:hypothetical protein
MSSQLIHLIQLGVVAISRDQAAFGQGSSPNRVVKSAMCPNPEIQLPVAFFTGSLFTPSMSDIECFTSSALQSQYLLRRLT